MSLRPIVLAAAVSLLAFAVPRPAADESARARDLLEHFVGTWDVDMTFMGMPPSKGTETITALTHGLTLVSEYRSPMGPGMEFEGHGLFGYDPKKGVWVQVWADNTDPAISINEGKWSEDGKSFMVEEEIDMGMGPMDMAMVTTIVDADSHTFTMTDRKAAAGAPPVMKATYKRRAAK